MAHPTAPEGPEKAVWAYAYQLDPPRLESQLGHLRHLLDEEQASARLGARTWQARFVLEAQVTHILVVSDTPSQHRHVNRGIEAELKRLNAPFSITVPLAISSQPMPPDGDAQPTS